MKQLFQFTNSRKMIRETREFSTLLLLDIVVVYWCGKDGKLPKGPNNRYIYKLLQLDSKSWEKNSVLVSQNEFFVVSSSMIAAKFEFYWA